MEVAPMSDQTPTHDAVREIWDRNASFWDEHMAEGNLFHRHLIGPSAERLLAIEPGERVIEFGCGNGQFSRRMAELGATVFATDVSPNLIEHARERTARRADIADRVSYAVLDAADPESLSGVDGSPFDAAVCNMAIMDMIEIDPLFAALSALLEPGGRFVFTIMHPCLNNPGGTTLTQEDADVDGVYTSTFAVRVITYRTTGATRGLAVLGQPVPQWYFHRTLSDLLNAAFKAGLVMDGMEEPYFPPDVSQDAQSLSWRRFTEIPPVLAVRLRPMS
jgi:2-polyprenyl-3-methyl-5-hydroxy-6-metoxy-1,4-benzoquinol methylase